jgi:hypothetical protein
MDRQVSGDDGFDCSLRQQHFIGSSWPGFDCPLPQDRSGKLIHVPAFLTVVKFGLGLQSTDELDLQSPERLSDWLAPGCCGAQLRVCHVKHASSRVV